jgi:hypothetical protein
LSWMEIDDGILDHPKFIRAVNMAGSDVVHLWLGIRSYCAKHLTDGFLPSDMLGEVRGPKGKARDKALVALQQVGLLDNAEGGYQMHNFLKWSTSRAVILERRQAAKERKDRWRRNVGGGQNGTPPPDRPPNVQDANGTRSGMRSEREPERVGSRDGTIPHARVSTTPTNTTPLPAPDHHPPDEDDGDPERPIVCPPDLKLTPAQFASLQMNIGIDRESADLLAAKFTAKMAAPGTGAESRSLTRWLRSLSTAVTNDWNKGERPLRQARGAASPNGGNARGLMARAERLEAEERRAAQEVSHAAK